MRKIISTWGLILLLLVSFVGTAAAQTGVTPTPAPTSQPAGSTTYQHPIVQILSAYFGRETRPMLPTVTETPTETPTVTETPEGSGTPTETPAVTETPTATETPTETPTVVPGPEEYAEQIATYHAEGMGFGVLVKLYAMSEASVEACLEQMASAQGSDPAVEPTQPACEAVTVDQLVNEFKSGAGVGLLFKEYGKPALLGVGQVKKALKNQPAVTPTPAPTGAVTSDPASMDSNAQTKNQKSNNGNGNSQGNNGNGNDKTKTHGPKK